MRLTWAASAPGDPRPTRLARWSLLVSVGLLLVPPLAVGPAGGPAAVIAAPPAGAHEQIHAALHEAPLMPPTVDYAPLPRTGWTVTADSQEVVAENAPATNAIDGDLNTYWHSQWKPSVLPLPHWLKIDMKRASVVGGLIYRPRPEPNRNGNIGQYQVHVSLDGTNWGSPVATGTFPDTADQKTIAFPAVTARYVRLTALTEAGMRGGYTNVAELHLVVSVPRRPGPWGPSSSGWSATADSQEVEGENASAANAIDGDPLTYWHSQWKSATPPLPHWLTIDMKKPTSVGGLVYLPRPAPNLNGNIGRYEIYVAATNVAWGVPVASGMYADDSSPKTVTFPAVTGRYLRLVALSEAGGRGPFTSAAEVRVLTGTPAPDPAKGMWSSPVGFPLIPVAAAQLPDGKLLVWSAYKVDNYGMNGGLTQTAIFDPATLSVSQRTITNTQHDMFCPGTSMLPDGRLVVTGGSDAGKTSVYDPATDAWSAGPAMNIPRGYQGQTTLADGRVFVLGGSWSGGSSAKNGEVWTPGGSAWQLLSGVPSAPIVTGDARTYRADNHGWFFTWTGNRVFQAGPSKQMNWISTTANGSITAAGNRADDGDAMNGNAVMYDIGKILTVGGAPAYDDSDARRSAFVIDINAGVSTHRVASMAYPRGFVNSVVLPDGKVLVLGGQQHALPFSDATSVYTPELWDPATETFTRMSDESTPRNYHSVALLLPDGRVFSAGGGLCGGCGTNHADAQIFTPPYLLNPDGTPRPRPTITQAPSIVDAGGSLSVDTDKAVTRFALVRLGAVTHTVNNDQRRIPLTPVSASGTTYTLTVPADRGIVLPGNYMLFALDAAGVPSVAKIIQIH